MAIRGNTNLHGWQVETRIAEATGGAQMVVPLYHPPPVDMTDVFDGPYQAVVRSRHMLSLYFSSEYHLLGQ